MKCPKTVAYSGIEGSFASISISKIFPEAKRVSYKNFKEAYEAAEKGECDVAVLPVENSFAGDVSQVTDLMYNGSLFIDGVYELTICQCLLGVEGSSIESIKTVKSHPQALDQCNEYIYDHGYKTIQAENTARAAKDVADKKDITLDAIASKDTAKLYGLTVLEKGINQSNMNTTRFAVFTRDEAAAMDNDTADTFIMMFAVNNEVGTLARAISVIGDYGYNMRMIKSRPLHDEEENWQYYFYTEVEGCLKDKEVKKMLTELEEHCRFIKVVGGFKFGEMLS